MNPNETEGMPEKARKGYAAFSNFRGSILKNKHMQNADLALLCSCECDTSERSVDVMEMYKHQLTHSTPSCLFHIENAETHHCLGFSPTKKTVV